MRRILRRTRVVIRLIRSNLVIDARPVCPSAARGYQVAHPVTAEARYRRALGALRKFLPGSLSAHDSAPHRVAVFGIHITEISGRSARSAG